MTTLTNDQQNLLDNIKLPKGWTRPNPSWNPSPFPYFNSYTNPAYKSGLRGSGWDDAGPIRYSNQFTSALTQPLNRLNHDPRAGKKR